MPIFETCESAKEFLIQEILAEAKREVVPLSEVERKMLYFTETEETLPQMAEISTAFDLEYDQDDYEAKISALIRKIVAQNRTRGKAESAAWNQAIQKLRTQDHYLLVLIAAAKKSPTASGHPPHDRLKLFATAAVIVTAAMVLAILLSR